jgi:hypothetical protein
VDARQAQGRRLSVHQIPKISSAFRPDHLQPRAMADRISLQSRALAAAIAQRDTPPWRKLSRREWDEMFDPCRWREPVYAWLLANHAKVVKARQPRNGWNGMEWDEIAHIMVLDGVVGSRGDPPNANSVRRVWGRVCQDKERWEERKAARKADS